MDASDREQLANSLHLYGSAAETDFSNCRDTLRRTPFLVGHVARLKVTLRDERPRPTQVIVIGLVDGDFSEENADFRAVKSVAQGLL